MRLSLRAEQYIKNLSLKHGAIHISQRTARTPVGSIQMLILSMTIYLAKRMKPYCARWPPPREMLVAEVSN